MRRLLLSIAAVAALAGLPSPAVATHGTDLDCPDFPNQAAAQAQMDAHPGDPDGLDGDGDGSACETLPCPCAAATAPTPPPPPASASASPVAARKATARVVRVIDGDTLEVRLATAQTVSVRLIGIDTPETVKPGTRVQCGGRDATARMKKLALRDGAGRTVTLKGDPAQGLVDRFGRLLAYVSAGGVDFGRTMVSSGWAKVLVVGQGFERAPSYRRAQALAKAPRRGVWRTCGGHFHRPR